MREIKINKNYEDLKIGENVFQVDLSYSSFQRCKKDLAEIAEVLKTQDAENEDKIIHLSRAFINGIFADEPFEEILETCGDDMFIVFEVMVEVVKMIEEKSREISKNMKVLKFK